jgi:hypothetical protein
MPQHADTNGSVAQFVQTHLHGLALAVCPAQRPDAPNGTLSGHYAD